MTYGMDDGRYSWDDGERVNRVIRDIFAIRWCREADTEDPEDVRRLDDITVWLSCGARLWSEDSVEYRRRLETCSSINELLRGRP